VLRKALTPSEAALWKRLQPGLEGHRFELQVPLFGYVVDFYCRQLKLVVEVDGSSHRGKERLDELRGDDLRARRMQVVRVPSRLVINDIEQAIETLRAEIRRRSSQLGRPRPQTIVPLEVETCRHGRDALLCSRCKLVDQAMRQPERGTGGDDTAPPRRSPPSGRGRYSTTPGLVNRPPEPPDTVSRQGY
jgi:very-short-patch-repair endonuclease